MGYTLTEFLEGSTKPQIQRGLTAILQNPNLTGNPRGVIDHKAVTDLVPAHEWIFDTDGFQLEMRQRIEDPTWEIFITGGNLPTEVIVPENWCDDDQISKVTFHGTNFHTLNYKSNIETVFDHCKNTFAHLTAVYLSTNHARINNFTSKIKGTISVKVSEQNKQCIIHFGSNQSNLDIEGYFSTCNISGENNAIIIKPHIQSTINIFDVKSPKLTCFQNTEEQVDFNIDDSSIDVLNTLEIRPSKYNIKNTQLHSYLLLSEHKLQESKLLPFLAIDAAPDASFFDFQITYGVTESTGYIEKLDMTTGKCNLLLQYKILKSLNFSTVFELIELDLRKCQIDSFILKENTIKKLASLEIFETVIGYMNSVSLNSIAFPTRHWVAKSDAVKWKQACLYLSDLMKKQSEPDACLFLQWQAQYYRMLSTNSISEYCFLRIYRLLSDFGMSTLRPFLWLLFFVAVFAAFHYIYTIFQINGSIGFLKPWGIDAEILQRGFWRPLIMGVMPLFRTQNIDLLSHVMSIFHLNVSLLLFFLLGFAIRNKIRINPA